MPDRTVPYSRNAGESPASWREEQGKEATDRGCQLVTHGPQEATHSLEVRQAYPRAGQPCRSLKGLEVTCAFTRGTMSSCSSNFRLQPWSGQFQVVPSLSHGVGVGFALRWGTLGDGRGLGSGRTLSSEELGESPGFTFLGLCGHIRQLGGFSITSSRPPS